MLVQDSLVRLIVDEILHFAWVAMQVDKGLSQFAISIHTVFELLATEHATGFIFGHNELTPGFLLRSFGNRSQAHSLHVLWND